MDFYDRNQYVLAKLNKNTRVPEMLKIITTLPMVVKHRQTLPEPNNNRIFPENFYTEDSLEAPARIID